MKLVLGHGSALEFWRSVRVEPRRYFEVLRARTLLGTPPNVACLPDPGPWWLTRPLHVMVADAGARRSSKTVTSHVWSAPLPKGSVLDTGNGFCICSPELCFLQMAETLSLIKLIELGFELCGTYDTLVGDVRSCAPLTTAARLSAYLATMPDVKGRKNAVRALRYVADNAASPKESVLVMLLCLPYSLGGYGIGMPCLNYRVDVGARAKKIAAKSYYVCDLYWPRYRLAVEYESDQFHTGSDRIANDSARRNALEAMGISVVTVTRRQMRSSADMNGIARTLAKRTGKRLRYVDPGFTRACLRLRGELLQDQPIA